MLAGRSFIVEPDIYFAYPGNRAYVEGRASVPFTVIGLWIAVGGAVIVDIVILLFGLGVVPVPIPPEYRNWIVLTGVGSVFATMVMTLMFWRLQSRGQLLEARVTVADVRPNPSRSWQQIRYIKIEFRDPDNQQVHVAVIRRVYREGMTLPKVGAQAAVLYAGPHNYRVL